MYSWGGPGEGALGALPTATQNFCDTHETLARKPPATLLGGEIARQESGTDAAEAALVRFFCFERERPALLQLTTKTASTHSMMRTPTMRPWYLWLIVQAPNRSAGESRFVIRPPHLQQRCRRLAC